MEYATSFNTTNDELRDNGIHSVEYDGKSFTEDAGANRLILARLDGGSELLLEGEHRSFNGRLTLLTPEGEPGYTYHGAAGSADGLDRSQAITIITYHQGKITALL